MKSINSVIVFLFAAMFFTSCQKEFAIVDPPTIKPIFKAVIDGGREWRSTDSLATATITDGKLHIVGYNAESEFVEIYIQTTAPVSIGTYYLDPAEGAENYLTYITAITSLSQNYATNRGPVSAQSGKVIITSIDTDAKTISGTFECSVYKDSTSTKKTVTQGLFTNVPYTNGGTVNPDPGTEPDPGTDPEDPGGETTTTVFEGSIDGTPVSFVNPTVIENGNVLIIAAGSLSGSLNLVIPATITPGNYTFNNTNIIGQFTELGFSGGIVVPIAYNAETTGSSLVIQEHNTTTKTIKGTFSFTASPTSGASKVITGHFVMTY